MKVAYEQGRHKDLRDFAIMTSAKGGALDSRLSRFFGEPDPTHGKQRAWWGESRTGKTPFDTSDFMKSGDWMHTMNTFSSQLPSQSFRQPTTWQKVKAFFSKGQ
ncbi:MAG: hypothetical protein FJ098_15260 [Deltaproteobacteria bacterium]|nr:hypothetical protein [Deltaproteobacteria bacterium]